MDKNEYKNREEININKNEYLQKTDKQIHDKQRK